MECFSWRTTWRGCVIAASEVAYALKPGFELSMQLDKDFQSIKCRSLDEN